MGLFDFFKNDYLKGSRVVYPKEIGLAIQKLGYRSRNIELMDAIYLALRPDKAHAFMDKYIEYIGPYNTEPGPNGELMFPNCNHFAFSAYGDLIKACRREGFDLQISGGGTVYDSSWGGRHGDMIFYHADKTVEILKTQSLMWVDPAIEIEKPDWVLI